MLDTISAFLRGFFYATREGAEKLLRAGVGVVVDEWMRRAGKRILFIGFSISLLGLSLLFLGLGAATFIQGFITIPGGGFGLVGLVYGLLGLMAVLTYFAIYR